MAEGDVVAVLRRIDCASSGKRTWPYEGQCRFGSSMMNDARVGASCHTRSPATCLRKWIRGRRESQRPGASTSRSDSSDWSSSGAKATCSTAPARVHRALRPQEARTVAPSARSPTSPLARPSTRERPRSRTSRSCDAPRSTRPARSERLGVSRDKATPVGEHTGLDFLEQNHGIEAAAQLARLRPSNRTGSASSSAPKSLALRSRSIGGHTPTVLRIKVSGPPSMQVSGRRSVKRIDRFCLTSSQARGGCR